MELSGKKRLLLGITIIGIVVLCFVSGYFLGKVKPSGRVNFNYASEMDEVVDYLDKYYYKDYDEEEFKKAYIKGGVSSLNDPYTYVYYVESSTNTNYFGYGIGVSNSSLGYKISSVTKDSPADLAGIKKGDYLIGIDDLKMGKNSISEIDSYMTRRKDEESTMYLLRNYREYSVKIKKATISKEALVESKLIGNIGYIKINQFDEGVSTSFKEQLTSLESKNITGLIVDVRDNPGGLASEVSSILRLFLTGDDAFLYLEGKNGNPDIYRANNVEKKSYDIKVLINENSASASEVFALAMNRVMNYDLIGMKTFGKGVFQQDVKLTSSTNGYLHVTCGYWYGYNKENIHTKGIEPTVEIDSSYYTPYPISETTFEFDMASDSIKDIEMMLEALGYETRTDGYFDSILKDILVANYSSEVLNYATSKKIYDDYKNYINDINNDKAINKALSLFE